MDQNANTNTNEIGKLAHAQIDASINAAMTATDLTPLDEWVDKGVNGLVMCSDCGIRAKGLAADDICAPCPAAWRVRENGVTEYWREPRHGV